jgi:two-component system, OmpR family, sensor kinase
MRLYVQVYLTVVAVAVLCFASTAGLAVLMSDGLSGFEKHAQDLSTLFASSLPEDPAARQAHLEGLGASLHGDVAIWDADGSLLAETGPVPSGAPGPFHRKGGHGLRVQLEDGRVVGYLTESEPGRRLRFFALLAVLAAVVALGTWPVTRRLTSRLEGLRSGVTAWGAGDLKVRVPAGGSDEVAEVARAFNQAADQVQRLVDAQRRGLASASHELRSPLARLMMTLELLDDDQSDPRVQRALADVRELDDTVGDMLDASRMQAQDGPADPVRVELLDLLEALGGVQTEGASYVVSGDERLLRRMLRNLVENARKYGAEPIVVATTSEGLTVTDAGEAPDEGLWERVFEPFYRPQGHAEGVHGGVGLGLALVRQIARFHGGDATLRAHEGRTQVVVTLPRAAGEM